MNYGLDEKIDMKNIIKMIVLKSIGIKFIIIIFKR